VDDNIERLRNVLKSLEDERRRLTAIPADAHPVGVPEVLGYIMEWGVHLDAFEPETLLQVSRHWNRVALGTPGVWARIVRKPVYMDNFSQFLLRCKKYLERSKSHPLLIDVDFLYFYFESPTNVVYTQFAELVQPHLHRCYHISLANPRESLAHLFSSLGPDVEHIAHYCANATHRGPPLALPQILPNLRHLSGTFPLPIFANIEMPALEHLQIALSPVNPSFHDLLYILQRCPNLKSLLFDNVSFTLAVEPDLTGVIVPLLKLKRLEFHCSGTADAMLLTSHCLMPNIRELCITGNMLPIPLELFRNITSLHCSDWDFPWFIRALRVATQLESLTVRSHGADSPFHTELLPALSNTASTPSSSLANLLTTPASMWLVPKLRSLHLASLSYNDFPTDSFLTFLRKRTASPSAQTIEKIVLEDVSHVTDFNIEQLKSEVETVEVVKTTAAPISFPFLPLLGRGPPGNGLGAIESPAAAMHPIILPPVAYGAPLITPPPVEGDHRLDPIDMATFGARDHSPPRRRRARVTNTRSRSPIPVPDHRRSPPVIVIQRSRSRSRSGSPVHLRMPLHEASSMSDIYTYRSRSPSASSRRSQSRSLSPPPMRRRYRRSRSPAVTTVALESGRSRSSRSQSPHMHLSTIQGSLTPLSSDHSEGSPLDVEQREQNPFPELITGPEPAPDMLRQSTIIIRSPTSSFSISPRRRHSRGRSPTRVAPETATPPRRHSLLPSMSSSRSSTARSSTHSRSPSRDEEPYHYGLLEPELGNQLEFDAFVHPVTRPRQIQATMSASTDSTLPTGRDQTAFMVRNRELGVERHPAHRPINFPGQRPMQSRTRSFSSPANDLRLFFPVNAPPHSPTSRLAATLPIRRQHTSPNPTIVQSMTPSNLNDRETQRTSITISPSPRLRGSDSTQLKDKSPSKWIMI
jgi:hypothetical protein